MSNPTEVDYKKESKAVEKEVLTEEEKQKLILEKYQQDQNKKLEKIKDNLTKYPHAIPETLRFDVEHQKFKVDIRCVKTGKIREGVYTSDLRQVTMCKEAQEEERKNKATVKRAQERRFKEAMRAQEEQKKKEELVEA